MIGFGSPVRPLDHSVLYLRCPFCEASPQAISGRTSYHRVRLAFHADPQLIQTLFNVQRFGPPLRVTEVSPWPWVDHPASGLLRATLAALFGLAFAATAPYGLVLPRIATRRLIKQKARRHTSSVACAPDYSAPTACKLTVSGTISLPSPGYFSPFPHGTGSLSVSNEYLALGRGRPGFTRNFTCPVLLGWLVQPASPVSPTGLSPSMIPLSRGFGYRFGL